jgi:hypothetical protein
MTGSITRKSRIHAVYAGYAEYLEPRSKCKVRQYARYMEQYGTRSKWKETLHKDDMTPKI